MYSVFYHDVTDVYGFLYHSLKVQKVSLTHKQGSKAASRPLDIVACYDNQS
jgi:hypothetical protein